MPKLKVNGADIYYELHGKGTPLVLIAGYACDHIFWLPVLESLRHHFQVLIFDNRAIGQTKDANEKLSVDLMAEDVIALCEQLDIKNPHIVGHSMGGAIAQSIGIRYSDKINKLVILASAVMLRTTILFAFGSLLQMRKENIPFNVIFREMLPWVFGDNFLNNPTKIEILKKAYIENPYPQSIQDQERQFHVLEQFNLREQIKNIRATTLIVRGTRDIICLAEDSAFLTEKIPHATFKEVECAHNMTLECPKPLSDLLIQFLCA